MRFLPLKVVDAGLEDSLAKAWQQLDTWTAFHSLATDWKFLVTVYTCMAVYSLFKQIFLAKALKSWILCAFGNV